MSPFFMNKTLMSCPPMSQMTSTSPKNLTALIMCATVSTMLTSALHALLQHVGRVPRGAEADDLELGAAARHVLAKLGEQLLRVLDGVALRELVGLADDLALFVEQHGLARGAAAVDPDHAAHHLAGRERHGREARDGVHLLEVADLVGRAHERRPGALAEARLASVLHVVDEPLEPAEAPHVRGLAQAVHARAEGRVVLRVVGHEDELFDGHVFGVGVAALSPRLGDAQAPALLQEGQVGVGAAEQDDAVLERRAARQHREVLQHDGVGQRAQDLRAGMPLFTRLTMSVSAKTPHLAATWCSLRVVEVHLHALSGGRPTLIMHLSMVAPVPEAHLSFIDGAAVFSPVAGRC
jgi:hypothetical protein